MTEDTKRALEVIKPMADYFNIRMEVHDNFLYLDDDRVAIAENSTFATILEFVGYVFMNMWCYNFKYRFDKRGTLKDVKQACSRYVFRGKNL